MVACYCLATQHLLLTSYNPGPGWITYHPRASLITGMQDHPKKTKQAQPSVHRSQQVATQSKHQAETTQTKETRGQQVNYKQGLDYDRIPWCL